MSYTPTNWRPRDKVTSTKLNKLEQGVEANSTFVVTLTPVYADYSGSMDATPAEIYEAYSKGQNICFSIPSMDSQVEVTQAMEFTVGANTRVALEANVFYEVDNVPVIIRIVTSISEQTYSTTIDYYENSPFLVVLSPTSLDYSGTMDCTVSEIYGAYLAGRRIIFRLWFGTGSYVDVVGTLASYNSGYSYPSFEGYAVDPSTDSLIYAYTAFTNDPDKDTYSAIIYPLSTPSANGESF